MATDLPWNGSVRRKAPEEGLGGLVSGISVSAGRPAAKAASPTTSSGGTIGGTDWAVGSVGTADGSEGAIGTCSDG